MKFRIFLVCVCAGLFAATPAAADETFVGAPCEAQSDCPVGFVCQAVDVPCETGGCDCPPCAFGEDCSCDCVDEAADACIETATRCVLSLSSCTSDADCTTPGFVCNERESCSGGECVCAPCAEGEDCPCDCEEPFEEECEIDAICAPPETHCATDADCDHGWECAFGEAGERCECVCTTCDSPGCEEECECNCEEGEAEGICLPPGWAEQFLSGVEGGAEAGGPRHSDAFAAEDDNHIVSCSAAGGGTASLFGLAALALALRRRR